MPLLIVILLAAVFYLLIPIFGAFVVRHQWRTFRALLNRGWNLPALPYGITSGLYHTHGSLESVQGDNMLWLRSAAGSVGVNVERTAMYILPGSRSYGENGAVPAPKEPNVTPRVVTWKHLFALAEGTHFFVAGTVQEYQGAPMFSVSGKQHPLVVLYDCPESAVLRRGTWTGRQRNEYWNSLTPLSLIAGVFANLVLLVFVFPDSRLASLQAFTAAVLPLMPLMPPGVVGYYFYRRIWRRARRCRAISDVLRTGREGRAPKRGNDLRRDAYRLEFGAIIVLLGSLALNSILFSVLMALTLFAA
jgi:hypothetical protein